jgi:hypothetical protein
MNEYILEGHEEGSDSIMSRHRHENAPTYQRKADNNLIGFSSTYKMEKNPTGNNLE